MKDKLSLVLAICVFDLVVACLKVKPLQHIDTIGYCCRYSGLPLQIQWATAADTVGYCCRYNRLLLQIQWATAADTVGYSCNHRCIYH